LSGDGRSNEIKSNDNSIHKSIFNDMVIKAQNAEPNLQRFNYKPPREYWQLKTGLVGSRVLRFDFDAMGSLSSQIE
jgi:hypothetical protein